MTEYGEWFQCQSQTMAMIGRVYYIVDNGTNTTSMSTSYASQVTFELSGTMVTSAVTDIFANGSDILTRTDVNAAGPVTTVIERSGRVPETM